MSDIDNIGQNTNTWDSWWKNLTPKKEIQKWDYYGLRPWILKYTPRNDKVIEAGCGLGRWALYLSKLNIDIEGLDFSSSAIDFLNQWKKKNKFNTKFVYGDVCNTPYDTGSVSGYISLGVIEHFKEGPSRPLIEAFRILRPGGVAIISTPSVSWYVLYSRIRKKFKDKIKLLIGRKVIKAPFFQYEYRPKKLKKFVEQSGLLVTRCSGLDLLYTFSELGKFKGNNIQKGTFGYWFSHKFENTYLKNWGAQSVVIAVKEAEIMHCFFCGQLNAFLNSLQKYDVPTCDNCEMVNKNINYYIKKHKTGYDHPYIMSPDIMNCKKCVCYFCEDEFESDIILETYGFSKEVCPECIQDSNKNLELSNRFLHM